jgi:uncharacterized integral membrane protein
VWILRWTFIAVIVLVILGFSLQNAAVVDVHLWTWHWEKVPLFLVAYFAFAAGMVVFLFAAIVKQIQHQTAVFQYRKEIKRLKEELDRIRTISLEDGLVEEQHEPATAPQPPEVL